jgi:hypothetical protein
MYCIRRIKADHNPTSVTGYDIVWLEYFKYNGWERFDAPPIDLSGVVLFTEGERKANTLQPNEEWQWYGSYKR